jgi:hypothetical protein
MKENNWIIELPETKNPSNLSQWAIIKYQFSRLREVPQDESKIINYLPEGVIVSIIKKQDKLTKFNNKKGHWFYVDYEGEKGWVFESFIEIFNSYDEALKRSEEIILGNKEKENN